VTKSRPYPYMQGADSLVLGRSPDSKHAAALGRIRLEERQTVHLLPMRGSAGCAGLAFSKGVDAGHSLPLRRGSKALVQKRQNRQYCVRDTPNVQISKTFQPRRPKRHTTHARRKQQRDEPHPRGVLYDRGLGSEASLETFVHTSC